jgi:hypothetical protein
MDTNILYGIVQTTTGRLVRIRNRVLRVIKAALDKKINTKYIDTQIINTQIKI